MQARRIVPIVEKRLKETSIESARNQFSKATKKHMPISPKLLPKLPRNREWESKEVSNPCGQVAFSGKLADKVPKAEKWQLKTQIGPPMKING